MRTRRLAALAVLAALALAPAANAALVAWYPFEDAGGAQSPVNRANAGTNDGTVSGPATYVGTTPNGSSWAMNFNNPGMNSSDGSGGYVSLGASATGFANFSTGITVSAWVNTATYTNWGRVVDFGNGAGVQNIVLARNGTSNNLRWEFQGTGAGTMTQDVNGVFQQNTWQHLLATVDPSGTSTVYLNGTPVGTRTGAALPPNVTRNSNWIARSNWGGDQYFNGMMDDVAVWNNTLGLIDIKKLATGAITPAQATLDARSASYKIVAYNGEGTIAGNTLFSAYLSDLRGGSGSTGIQFATGSGTDTASAAGSVAIRLANPAALPSDPDYAPDRLHVQALLNFSNPDPNQLDPRYYLAAQLTAPPGYVFEFTSGAATVKSQYFTSLGYKSATPPGTDWTASNESWDFQAPTGVSTNPYAVPVSSSSLAGGPWAPATQGIWARQNPTTVYDNVYFDAPLRMIPGAWDVLTNPVANPGTQPGLSARIARVNDNIDTLAQATAALSLTPGQTNFNASQVVAIPRADLDAGGNFNSTAGLLAGDTHSAAANPEDYAVRMAGYMQITPGNLSRTFALRGDNEWAFSIGGVQYYGSGDSNPPTLLPLTFPASGYYPFEVLYRNRDGAALLEVSSALGDVRTFDTSTFALLGNDPVGLPVLQDPNYTPGTTQANSVGAPLVPGGINPVADGFRVQQAYPASHGGANPTDVANAISFFADKTILNGNQANYNIGVVAWNPANADPNLRPRTRLDMQDTTAGQGNAGNLSPTDAVPIDNFNTSYAAQAGVANDNYVTRMNGLLYIDAPGVRAFTVSTDDGYYLRVGSQVLGTRPGAGGTPAGTANTVYGNFPAAGLYPFEFYQYEGGGGSGIEIGQGGSTNLLLASGSRNPASNGFTNDFTNLAYRVEPVAAFKTGPDGVNLVGKAFANVPALGMNVPVEHWKLEKRSISNQGLFGQKYSYPGNDPVWDDTRPLLAQQVFFGTGGTYPNFSIPDGRGFGFTGNTQVDQIGARYTGYLKVPTTGSYNFQMNTDDVSWIFIDIDGDYDIPGPGYHVFESGEAAPGNQAWTVNWNTVNLTAGLHWVEFRSREYGGGEWNNVYWSGPGVPWGFIDGSYFQVPAGQEYPVWQVLTQGAGTSVGDLLSGDFGDLYTFPYGTSEYLRLSVDIAGLLAIAEGQFLFVPEPMSLVLLGGGLLALARRRRKNAR